MAEAPVILLEVQPRAVATGTRQTFRFAGHGAKYPYRYNNQHWTAGLSGLPVVIAGLDYQGSDMSQGAVPQALAINWAPSSKAALDAVQAFFWKGAPFTIYLGPENAAGTLPPVLLSGKIMDCKVTDGTVQLSMADPATDLAKPVLTATFAGTGGLEGPADWEGRPKRRIWGNVFNVEGFLIDAATNTYSFSDPAQPLNGFTDVRDKGASAASLTTLGWQGSIAATFTALKASTPPQGGGVIAPSIGMLKWWTRPAGSLCADIQGEFYLGNFVNKAAAIAQAIVASRSTVAFATGTVTAANTARPGPCGFMAEDLQVTLSAALDFILSGVSLYWVLNDTQTIRIGQWTFGASVGSFTSQSVDRAETYPPVQQRKIGYRKNYRVMSAGDLAAILTYGDGTPIDDLQPAQAGATQNQDGANMIPAPRDLTGTIFESGAGMGTAVTGGGRPADFYRIQFPQGSNGALAQLCEPIPVIPGELLWLAYVAKASATTTQTINAGYRYYSADGTLLGSTDLLDETEYTGAELLTTWHYITANITVPANAAFIAPYVERPNASAASTFWIGEPYLSRSQPGADVTSQSVPIMEVPGAQIIEATYDGTPKDGQLPRILTLRRFRGETDKSAKTEWTLETFGLTATINNTPDDPERGQVEVTAMDAPSEGSLRVTSSFAGSTHVDVVPFSKKLAPPPPPPLPTSVVIDVNGSGDNYLYDHAPIAEGTLTITSGLTVNLTAPLTLTTDRNPDIVRPLGKWQYSPAGAGTWSDVPPGEVYGTNPTYSWFTQTGPGYLTVNTSIAGLAAGSWDFRLMFRRDEGDPNPFYFYTGTATIQAVE